MNLDDIQSGSLCVIDTNVLLYAEQGLSAQTQRLLRRCSIGELIGVLPETVWQELAHKFMLAEAMMLGKIAGPNPAGQLRKKPDAVRSLSIYREKIAALQDLGLGFESCTQKDLLEEAISMQRRYGLLIKDAILLSTAFRIKADVIASKSTIFHTIEHITNASPSDIAP